VEMTIAKADEVKSLDAAIPSPVSIFANATAASKSLMSAEMTASMVEKLKSSSVMQISTKVEEELSPSSTALEALVSSMAELHAKYLNSTESSNLTEVNGTVYS